VHSDRRYTRDLKVSGNENSKGKRLEEKEKLEAELERSLAVAKVKAAHKQIEETEKLRKRSAAISICRRIQMLHESINAMLEAFGSNSKFSTLILPEGVALSIGGFEQTYTSIIYDFQKSLDLGDRAMTKMFPMVKVRKDIVDHAHADLLNLAYQLNQMVAYCERLLV
jgi:hypothetical protein